MIEKREVTSNNALSRPSSHLGFSVIELLVVVAIIMVMAAASLPMYNRVVHTFAIRNNANGIMGLMTTARMRAAADFARTKMTCDTSTSQCSVLVASFAGGSANPATSDFKTDSQSPQRLVLSKGVSFGVPSGVSAGVGGQSSPSQGSTVAGCSYCTIFNSRGLPVGTDGKLISDYAIYLQDAQYNLAMAVSVDVSGKAAVYRLNKDKTWTKITE